MSKSPHYRQISAKRLHWVLPGESAVLAGVLPNLAALELLQQDLQIPAPVAQLLARRGLVDVPSATSFLNPEFKSLHDPSLLPNIKTAVQRLRQALERQEPITLFGDYDVDGITGTVMLWHLLRAAGGIAGGSSATLRTYIPHRVDEGYGLSCPAIEKVVAELRRGKASAGNGLIITIDCGVAAREPIALARSLGVDVIVTDHHDFTLPLPDANFIVHPRVSNTDGSPSLYPNPHLCGAGVAFKLAWALAVELSGSTRALSPYRELLLEFSALVGLATIADIVPLLGENRVLVRYGLKQLLQTKLVGLRAFMHAAGFENSKTVNATDVGFTLAPRLNAAGRMDHAQMAVEMLTSADEDRAREIAEYLETQNRQRQTTQSKMLKAALAQVTADLPPPPPAPTDRTTGPSMGSATADGLPLVIVAHSTEHHAGVVGIVASSLVELYHRPAFVLACNEELCHGSARSIPGFDLHAAIEHCRPLLISGGGHAMAGGVKLRRENLPAFCTTLNTYAAGVLTPAHFIPILELDGLLTLADATIPLLTHLERFEPFGRGNPRPRFLLQQVRLAAPPRAVGSTGAHLQFQFAQGKAKARGIAFKAGPLHLHNDFPVGLELDLVVEPRIDRYFTTPRADFLIIDMARSDGRPLELAPVSAMPAPAAMTM